MLHVTGNFLLGLFIASFVAVMLLLDAVMNKKSLLDIILNFLLFCLAWLIYFPYQIIKGIAKAFRSTRKKVKRLWADPMVIEREKTPY